MTRDAITSETTNLGRDASGTTTGTTVAVILFLEAKSVTNEIPPTHWTGRPSAPDACHGSLLSSSRTRCVDRARARALSLPSRDPRTAPTAGAPSLLASNQVSFLVVVPVTLVVPIAVPAVLVPAQVLPW